MLYNPKIQQFVMNLSRNKTNILMLTHYTNRSEEGEDTDMRILHYLKDKTKKIVLITQPLPEFNHRTSFCLVYKNGRKIRELTVSVLDGPEFLKYLHHILIIYYFLFKAGINYDLCIALENLSFASVFPLRLLNIIKRLIYYSIDFSPQRFSNPFLNGIYHLIDKLACNFSDINWVMVKEQIMKRKKRGYLLNSSRFTIVPIGYETKNINILPTEKIDFYNLLYMGAIRESMGPQLAIQTIPSLIKKFPKIHLTIIGGGKYLDYLKKLVKKLKIADYVDFTGYIDSFKQMTDLMIQKSIGLAPYMPIKDSFSYFSDPSKIKLYFCCGLPAITTNVATISNLISKTKSGIVIDYSEKALAQAIIYLLGNKDRYQLYKSATIKLSRKFDINYILDQAFKNIPG